MCWRSPNVRSTRSLSTLWLEEGLKREGNAWARDSMLGYITACPSHVGTGGFRATVRMRTPLL